MAEAADGSEQQKRTPAQLVKRYACLCVGLFVLALGVSFSIKADLGTSPISSLPYVASLVVPLSVGTLTILMHVVMVIIQIVLLRSDFQLIQLLQVPVGIVFGMFIDFTLWCIDWVGYASYLGQWLLVAISIVLVAVGVSLEVIADVILLAGEGVMLAISKVTGFKFGSVKIATDSTLVALSVILSFVALGGLYGVREGTIAAAVLVGVLVRRIMPVLSKPASKLLK